MPIANKREDHLVIYNTRCTFNYSKYKQPTLYELA